MSVLEIDGSTGEGGGQVLRTALSLSVALGRPIRVENIRAGRAKPGLMRQHLTCVRAAAEISDAAVDGDAIGSQDVTLHPKRLRAGSYEFKVGTAGSCMLVLQTVLPPLLREDGPSEIVLEGGTHNPAAPPWDLIERAWFPALHAMGASVEGRIERYGFMPAGGGRVVINVNPGAPRPFVALDRGAISDRVAEAYFANLPMQVAERELKTVGARLGLPEDALKLREVKSLGPGNALALTFTHELGAEVIAEFGVKNRSAESVAKSVAKEAAAYLASGGAIGRHLADQLLVSLALMAGGRFSTVKPSRHTVTNAEIIRAFSADAVKIRALDTEYEIEVAPIAREST